MFFVLPSSELFWPIVRNNSNLLEFGFVRVCDEDIFGICQQISNYTKVNAALSFHFASVLSSHSVMKIYAKSNGFCLIFYEFSCSQKY